MVVVQRVVNLGEVRDLLKSWDEVREHIRTGQVKAFALTVQGMDGEEAIYHGGGFKTDRQAALKAGLRQSWAMTKAAEA